MNAADLVQQLREAHPLVRVWPEGCPVGDTETALRMIREGKIAAMTEGTSDNVPAENGDAPPGLVLVRMSDVEAERIEWLWHNRIATGKLDLLTGYGGIGKTSVALDVASRITRGIPFVDERHAPPREPGDVLIFTCEDGLADTLKPRLIAAEADTSRIMAVNGVRRAEDKSGAALFDMERDCPALDAALASLPNCKALIVDPLSAFFGRGIDSHKDADVRRVLGPLAKIAEQRRVAVIGIVHLSKQGARRAMDRLLGSVAIANAARVIYLCVPDKDDERRILFLPTKNNIAAPMPGLAFRVVPRDTAVGSVGAVEWLPDDVTITADEALGDMPQAQRRNVIDDAVSLLRDKLANGVCPKSVILREADLRGIGERTLERAKQRLGVVGRVMSVKLGEPKQSCWVLPEALTP